ncbi:SWR1-complex protein 5 [Ceratocystis lukuohia]|uniref:SWR1-complex protein 5 n=1 Tax=Ceratocystis lukuohia TaxID=2019550 RepID=A0ABR4MIL8_9PEZI
MSLSPPPPPPPNHFSNDNEDDDYNSAEDSDFAPGEADDVASESGGSDNELVGGQTEVKKIKNQSKRKGHGDGNGNDNDDDNYNEGFENSGDEIIIRKGKSRKRHQTIDKEDEGGEGGLIKTRRQRAAEKAEPKTAISSGPITIDVDTVFASMMDGNFSKEASSTTNLDSSTNEQTIKPTNTIGSPKPHNLISDALPASAPDADMILIRRKYNFAGKLHTEEKLVPRSSAEAKLYLDSLTPQELEVVLNSTAAAPASDTEKEVMERAPRKAFRSRFEPAVEKVTQRPDLQLGVALRLQAREEAKAAAAVARAKKLNTVEKSRMDWAGYVDKEGLKDELVLAGKAKDSFAERQEFLARTEAKREDEARRARMSARAQQQAL